MPKYTVEYDGKWNGEYYSGESVLELTDEQVKQLVDLIKVNGGETDVDALNLKEEYPAIYSAFREAFIEPVAFDGSVQWAIDGYLYYDLGEISGPSTEEVIKVIEAEGLFSFKFEYDEGDYLDEDGELDEERLMEDKCEAWREHFEELSIEDQFAFLERFYEKEIYDYDTQELTGNMYIPDEIIELAK